MGGFLDKIKGFLAMEEEEELGIAGGELSPDADEPRKATLIPISSRKSEILVLDPTSYQEALEAGEQLKKKRILILNMERADGNLARRIIDFLYGINYAQEGHMYNITNTIYLFTPNHIGIRSSGKRETRSGFFSLSNGGQAD